MKAVLFVAGVIGFALFLSFLTSCEKPQLEYGGETDLLILNPDTPDIYIASNTYSYKSAWVEYANGSRYFITYTGNSATIFSDLPMHSVTYYTSKTDTVLEVLKITEENFVTKQDLDVNGIFQIEYK